MQLKGSYALFALQDVVSCDSSVGFGANPRLGLSTPSLGKRSALTMKEWRVRILRRVSEVATKSRMEDPRPNVLVDKKRQRIRKLISPTYYDTDCVDL